MGTGKSYTVEEVEALHTAGPEWKKEHIARVKATVEELVFTRKLYAQSVKDRLRFCDVLEAALPLLIKLGDYIGNADGRCDVVLSINKIIHPITGGSNNDAR